MTHSKNKSDKAVAKICKRLKIPIGWQIDLTEIMEMVVCAKDEEFRKVLDDFASRLYTLNSNISLMFISKNAGGTPKDMEVINRNIGEVIRLMRDKSEELEEVSERK